MSTVDWWENLERGRIIARILPTAGSPAERRFRLAFFECVLDGIYPSGRQIYKRIGKRVDGKVNLNGRECQWLHSMRELFGIEPYVGYTALRRRDDWYEWLHGRHGGPKFPYKLRRGPRGTLIACDEYVDNRRAEQKALDRQLDNDRYGVNA